VHLGSTRLLITWQRVERERLIFVASFKRSPVAPVLLYLSLPAKSTRLNLPTLMCGFPLGSSKFYYELSIVIVNTL